jgi:hypothetical protein
LLLGPIVETVYGPEFSPSTAMAVLGGAGVGFGLGALFATQIYSAVALGAHLALGWTVALAAAVGVLFVADMEPVNRVALAFVVGEGTGLAVLGLVLPRWVGRAAD